MISWKHERFFLKQGLRFIAGVDEAGRGPLAGPVVAAAVILPLSIPLPRDCFGVNDSKQLTEADREALFDSIHSTALAIGVGIRDHTIIDEVNILQATMLAMCDAIDELNEKIRAEHLLVDGNYFRTSLSLPFRTIVDGDAISPSIAAASIIAKVTRDRIMRNLHNEYPHYNFSSNKGYGTREHRAAIKTHGLCPIHRRSFKLKEDELK